MAKASETKLRKKVAKKSSRKTAIKKAVRRSKPAHATQTFRFPSNASVIAARQPGPHGERALEKIRQTYRSAGYEISGLTSDGVVIIRPEGAPDSFTLAELRKAITNLPTRDRRTS